MAYTVVGLPSDVTALTDAIERGRAARYSHSSMFISQDTFNDIIRHASIYEVALAVEKHRHMVVGFDGQGMSPLMCAADRVGVTRQELDVLVGLLIKAGAKMDAGRYSESTPLCYAATKGPHVLSVFAKYETNWKLYTSFETKPWQIALHASIENFVVMLPYLTIELCTGYDVWGHTLLIEMIRWRPYLAWKLASRLPFRRMVNTPDRNGETPLAHAARLDEGRHAVVSALFRCGATLLFHANNVTIGWSDATRITPGLDYIRKRIRFTQDTSPFDVKYDAWYKQVAI